MKKRTLSILLVIFILLTSLFIGLWQYEKSNTKELESLCQNSIGRALEDFKEYHDMVHVSSYWYGVAEFRTFMTAYLAIHDESNTDYLYCNIVYGSMILDSENTQAHIDELIEALEYLADDYTDPNGYNLMANLGNALNHK